MPRYFSAGTNILRVPKEMVFFDKNKEPHLLPTLTKNKHIATHYGVPAVSADYNDKGNLLKLTRGQYTDYQKKVKKQAKAEKALKKANVAVENVVKKMRGRPRKNANTVIPVDAPIAPVVVVASQKKKRTISPEHLAKMQAGARAAREKKNFNRQFI